MFLFRCQKNGGRALWKRDLYFNFTYGEFYNCEYKYFMQFGLKLKERTVYGLTPAATGDFIMNHWIVSSSYCFQTNYP